MADAVRKLTVSYLYSTTCIGPDGVQSVLYDNWRTIRGHSEADALMAALRLDDDPRYLVTAMTWGAA